MQNERTHGDDSAGAHETFGRRSLSDDTLNLGIREHAEGCVPGSTRRGPLSSRESSKWSRKAIMRDSIEVGACAYVTPALTDHGPHPGISRR
jgi:hypothetical protein